VNLFNEVIPFDTVLTKSGQGVHLAPSRHSVVITRPGVYRADIAVQLSDGEDMPNGHSAIKGSVAWVYANTTQLVDNSVGAYDGTTVSALIRVTDDALTQRKGRFEVQAMLLSFEAKHCLLTDSSTISVTRTRPSTPSDDLVGDGRGRGTRTADGPSGPTPV